MSPLIEIMDLAKVRRLNSDRLQAYDLEELKEVAVKIHQLTATWSEAKKSSYVKHATREFNIHKSLQHPLIVALLDIFELDANSFATVLELCTGGDLDGHLKEHTVGIPPLPAATHDHCTAGLWHPSMYRCRISPQQRNARHQFEACNRGARQG